MATEVLREEIEAEEVEHDQYLVFKIGSQEFGIQAMHVQEISRVLDTTSVPNSPPYIEGIMNLRGRLSSVINFRKKFGFIPKEHDEDTRFIIVEHKNFPIGIIVDAVEEVIRIPDDILQKLPEATSTLVTEEFITNVGMMDKRLIILLGIVKVLDNTEILKHEEIKKVIEEVEQIEGRSTKDEG